MSSAQDSFEAAVARCDGLLCRNGWDRHVSHPEFLWTDRIGDEFHCACAYLDFLGSPIKNITYRIPSSYGLKHDAEKWHETYMHSHQYVSNGVMIAAIIAKGFAPAKLWPQRQCPNVRARVSLVNRRRVLREMELITGPIL